MFFRPNRTGDYFVLGPKALSQKDRSAFTVFRLNREMAGKSMVQWIKHAGRK